MMHIIFLDANFLLIPAQFQIDIYSNFKDLIPKPWKIIMIQAIFDELEKKINNSPEKRKLQKQFQLAIQLLKNQTYELNPTKKIPGIYVDDLILEEALKYQETHQDAIIYIATNDKELRKKCKRNNMRSVYLRQQKYIAVDE